MINKSDFNYHFLVSGGKRKHKVIHSQIIDKIETDYKEVDLPVVERGADYSDTSEKEDNLWKADALVHLYVFIYNIVITISSCSFNVTTPGW